MINQKPGLLATLLSSLLALFVTTSVALPIKTQQWQMPNEAKVIFYPAMNVPILDVYVAFRAGSAYDAQLFGLSALTTQLMNQGNGALDATQLAEKLEETGAQFDAESNRDLALFHLRTLTSAEALPQAIDALSLILNKPRFSEEAFYRERNQLLTLILQQEESPDEIANIAFFKQLYGPHPYAHPVQGTTETVKRMQSWQVRNFYKRYFVGSNAIVVMVGAINHDEATQLADKIVGALPKGEPATTIEKATPNLNPTSLNIPFPSKQTILRIGQLGVNHHNPDYFPLVIGNYILGGGAMVSQLAIEVREKKGLSYNPNSQLIPLTANGPFVIGLSTKNNQAETAIQATQQTLARFLKQGPSEKELSDAKQYLAGNFSLSLASNQSIANILLRIAFYHLPDNYLNTYVAHLESVTTEEINHAFNTLIKPNQQLQITVGQL